MLIFPICFQCGSGVNNPCKCKVVGPTCGFLGFILSAIICWPAGSCSFCALTMLDVPGASQSIAIVWATGAVTYCCNQKMANDCFGRPQQVNQAVTEMVPI